VLNYTILYNLHKPTARETLAEARQRPELQSGYTVGYHQTEALFFDKGLTMAQANKGGLLPWIFAYLLWVGVIFIVLAIMLMVRSALQQWLVIFLIHPRVVWVILQFFICSAGVSWMVIIFFVEAYFRKGLQQGRVWPRIKTVYQYLGIALGVALLALGSAEIYVRWLG
jgi:hypothetical protein